VKFAGHLISSAGIRPDPEKIESISAFPVPKCVSDLRSFLGMANQLGAFLPDLAQHCRDASVVEEGSGVSMDGGASEGI